MVVAPSGAGKSTLVNALLAQDQAIRLSVSYTTRAAASEGPERRAVPLRRPSTNSWSGTRQGEFLESAEVHGNYYAHLARVDRGADEERP